jgi:ribosomal protein S18 acetylase RimI-like enzyme
MAERVDQRSQQVGAKPFDLRDGRPDERAEIAELIVAAYEEYRPFVTGELVAEFSQDIERVLEDVHVETIVAENQEVKVGVIVFYPDGTRYGDGLPEGWGSMRLLAVDPKARRLGVGRALMSECFRRARERGLSTMLFHTMPFMTQAIALHESLGCRRAPEFDTQYGPGVPVVAYRLDLD